jgi:hypothetical protein
MLLRSCPDQEPVEPEAPPALEEPLVPEVPLEPMELLVPPMPVVPEPLPLLPIPPVPDEPEEPLMLPVPLPDPAPALELPIPLEPLELLASLPLGLLEVPPRTLLLPEASGLALLVALDPLDWYGVVLLPLLAGAPLEAPLPCEVLDPVDVVFAVAARACFASCKC